MRILILSEQQETALYDLQVYLTMALDAQSDQERIDLLNDAYAEYRELMAPIFETEPEAN